MINNNKMRDKEKKKNFAPPTGLSSKIERLGGRWWVLRTSVLSQTETYPLYGMLYKKYGFVIFAFNNDLTILCFFCKSSNSKYFKNNYCLNVIQ